jgi:hypothetical protein
VLFWTIKIDIEGINREMKTYPTVVSRTLDPTGKSLVTVVGLHDHQITDADVNLIQDLQDSKRQRLLQDKSATSGCLTYAPLQFNTFIENSFFIPAFDVLFNGEVVTVTGNASPDVTINRVSLPPPAFWTLGSSDEDGRIYVVFLEMWYQSLNPVTGSGYFVDPTNNNLRYFYPYGGVNPDPSLANIQPDDSVDIFNNGLFTTQRAQIQWRINVQRVALTYDFTKFQFGLDPGARPSEIVYAQALQTAPIVGAPYQFTNMGSINGDTGVWRAGDGNVNNSLGTMDGYSYAIPMAIAFQRNTGPFSLSSNLFGCASPTNPSSGLLRNRISGRFDSKLADQIFADDVVDTRQTVNLDGYELDKIMREGFVDVITSSSRLAIGRGESPGNKVTALGSALNYYVSISPAAVINTNTVGAWDGFSNGFSSDERIFKVTKQVTVNDKSIGIQGAKWALNDAFTLALPASSIGTIDSVEVQALFSNTQTGTKLPVNLLEGQIEIDGLASKSVTIKFNNDLTNTPFNPGANNLYVTLNVKYAAGTGKDLRKVPYAVSGGVLQDANNGKVLPVYGVSEYQVQSQQSALQAYQVWSVNPEYSNIIFGTKIWLKIPGSQGTQVVANGTTTTTFIINRASLNSGVSGLYCTRAWDFVTGVFYSIIGRQMIANQHILVIQGAVPTNSTLVVSMLAQDTAQLVYNAPVKGVTEIEETVLFGNYGSDSLFPMDNRISIESISYDIGTDTNTIVLGARDCIIKGISGDDTNKFIWVRDQVGNFNAITIPPASFSDGVVVVRCPGNNGQNNLTLAKFFFCGSILPAFDPASTLSIVESYVPYQGEGVLNRDYEIIHSEDNALVTTNGTGAAPIVGLKDVYPYNREVPISITLPAQVSWNDATLRNISLATFFDSNYEAMRASNVEHTFTAPLHTNDFIQPMNKDTRKKLRLIAAGGSRGFSQATPHVGFAIRPPVPRTVLGQNLQATTAPITLYVNNLNGNDANDGLSINTPKLTVTGALSVLPPVLRHPCNVQLMATASPYSILALKDTLQVIALGDGDIRASKYYALANISYSIQEEGRLVITRQSGTVGTVVIDATGFNGFGDGPTSAFFVDNSRVIFNGISFKGFRDPAIKGLDSNIDFVDCSWEDNIQSGSFEQGCSVIIDRGFISLPDGGTGMVLSQSELTVSEPIFVVEVGANAGAFFVAERQSTLNLQTHGTSTVQETNIQSSTVIAASQLNSSIVVTADFQSTGKATLTASSILARTIRVNPFLGGVDTDASSNVVNPI